MTRECIVHHGEVSDASAVVVGAVEQATVGGRLLYACETCVALWSLVTFAEHPEDSDGSPLRRHSDGSPGTRPFFGAVP
jgi:hypothetical protein